MKSTRSRQSQLLPEHKALRERMNRQRSIKELQKKYGSGRPAAQTPKYCISVKFPQQNLIAPKPQQSTSTAKLVMSQPDYTKQGLQKRQPGLQQRNLNKARRPNQQQTLPKPQLREESRSLKLKEYLLRYEQYDRNLRASEADLLCSIEQPADEKIVSKEKFYPVRNDRNDIAQRKDSSRKTIEPKQYLSKMAESIITGNEPTRTGLGSKQTNEMIARLAAMQQKIKRAIKKD